jgi:cbb3-type cytochrome oxidase subunit 3
VVTFWRSGVARALGVATMFGVLVAGILHFMRYGPLEAPDEPQAKAGKEAQP